MFRSTPIGIRILDIMQLTAILNVIIDRITESGDTRITESGDTRILE